MSLDPLNILLYLMIGWVLLYLVSQYLSLEKYNIEVAPLYLTYKTQRLNSFLQNTASKHPQFWRVASNIGVVTAVGEIILAIYILSNNLFNFLYVSTFTEIRHTFYYLFHRRHFFFPQLHV